MSRCRRERSRRVAGGQCSIALSESDSTQQITGAAAEEGDLSGFAAGGQQRPGDIGGKVGYPAAKKVGVSANPAAGDIGRQQGGLPSLELQVDAAGRDGGNRRSAPQNAKGRSAEARHCVVS